MANKKVVQETELNEVKTDVETTKSTAATAPAPVLRQIELADFDIEILNAGQYSEKAWESVGRRHKADPTTREAIAGTNGRGFLMASKNWPPLPAPRGVPVTTQNINNIMNEFAPIQAEGNMAAVRASLLSRDLTKTLSEETHEEDV